MAPLTIPHAEQRSHSMHHLSLLDWDSKAFFALISQVLLHPDLL